MMLATADYVPVSFWSVATSGASESARFVAAQLLRGRIEAERSQTLGAGMDRLRQDIFRVAGECSKPGWDGYGAEPISAKTFLQVQRFINALPLGMPLPSVGAEADGHMTLEWYQNPSRVLSVSISPEGDVHYAALLGLPTRLSGTLPFLGEMPEEILRIVRRLFAA